MPVERYYNDERERAYAHNQERQSMIMATTCDFCGQGDGKPCVAPLTGKVQQRVHAPRWKAGSKAWMEGKVYE
jgi:hypothetical protein